MGEICTWYVFSCGKVQVIFSIFFYSDFTVTRALTKQIALSLDNWGKNGLWYVTGYTGIPMANSINP